MHHGIDVCIVAWHRCMHHGIDVCIMASMYASWQRCMHHGIDVCIMASMYASWHRCMHHGIDVSIMASMYASWHRCMYRGMASMYADFLVLELLKLLILLLRPYYVSLKTISNKLNSDLVFKTALLFKPPLDR